MLNHNQDFQPLKIPLKRDKVIPGNQAIGTLIALEILQRLRGTIQHTLCLDSFSSSGTCPPSDARCVGSWLHTINWIKNGNGKFPEIYALYHGITTEFCPCNKSFVFANSETETCRESCIIHFPTTPPCFTRVVLETGDVPILFSLPQMKNSGMTIELTPKGDNITCPAFGLYSSPVESSTMGHVVLDLTSLAYQPKVA